MDNITISTLIFFQIIFIILVWYILVNSLFNHAQYISRKEKIHGCTTADAIGSLMTGTAITMGLSIVIILYDLDIIN